MSNCLIKSRCSKEIFDVLTKHNIGIGYYPISVADSEILAKEVCAVVSENNCFEYSYLWNMSFILNFDCDIVSIKSNEVIRIKDIFNKTHEYNDKLYHLMINDKVYDIVHGYGLMSFNEYYLMLFKLNDKLKICTTRLCSYLKIVSLLSSTFGLKKALSITNLTVF